MESALIPILCLVGFMLIRPSVKRLIALRVIPPHILIGAGLVFSMTVSSIAGCVSSARQASEKSHASIEAVR